MMQNEPVYMSHTEHSIIIDDKVCLRVYDLQAAAVNKWQWQIAYYIF